MHKRNVNEGDEEEPTPASTAGGRGVDAADGVRGARPGGDARLLRLLADAGEMLPLPEPPVEAMWAQIERTYFEKGRSPELVLQRPTRRWAAPAIGVAAGLLLGLGLGRGLWRNGTAGPSAAAISAATAASAPVGAVSNDRADVSSDAAYRQVTTEYFDRTAALLATLPTRLGDGRPDARLTGQANELLSTTRLLLDSQAARDPELHALLADLELVLVQIVRMPPMGGAGRTGMADEAELIAETVESRRMLPRLRSAAVQTTVVPNARGD